MINIVKQLCFILITAKVLTLAEYPYCYRFTWVGPFINKDSIGELTCSKLREDLTTIPCRHPLVATYNDLEPDTIDLWRKNYDKPLMFGCPMVPGESCVKYTYIYNKGVQNITYMCAKVNATRGCYRQKYISGLEVEVCVCQSEVNGIPCNYGSRLQCCVGSFVFASLLMLLYALANIS